MLYSFKKTQQSVRVQDSSQSLNFKWNHKYAKPSPLSLWTRWHQSSLLKS